MHQIVLLTALTATSGLFGGGRASSCASGSCGMTYAPAPSYAACAPGTPCGGYAQAPAPQPQYYYYPAPAPQHHGAPQAMAPRAYYPSAYYYRPTGNCAGGTCYR